MLEVRLSDAYRAAHPRLPFGSLVVEGVSPERLRPALDAARQGLPARLQDAAETIEQRVARFDDFFRSQGHRCPLPAQLAKIRRHGLPETDPFIEALLCCEMSTGILMGVQDRGRIEGTLVCDVTGEEEGFRGMRGPLSCRPGEIVLRDEQGILASYLQGPDHRTRITPETRSLAFFAFAAPGITAGELREALTCAGALFERAGARVGAGEVLGGLPEPGTRKFQK